MRVQKKKVKNLLDAEMDLMNVWMLREFGAKYVRDFKKYYPGDAVCFFIKEKSEIVAFGILNPIEAECKGKKYSLFGIGDIVTIKRGVGYGRILVSDMIGYLKKAKKTGLGFCASKNISFYDKVGLGTRKGLMRRFRYRDPDTGAVDLMKNGDGLFFSVKDKFVEDVLGSRALVYLSARLW